MLSCLIRLVWHSPYLLNLVFFPGRARSALLPYQDFFILFYFFEEGFGRHFANHRYEFLAFFFSSFHRPWETRTRLNWSNTEGKGSMQHGGRKKSSVPCACGASLQCTLPMTWCNFKRIFFEMLRTVASPETFVFRKIRKLGCSGVWNFGHVHKFSQLFTSFHNIVFAIFM